jgi:hypothetical protein
MNVFMQTVRIIVFLRVCVLFIVLDLFLISIFQ